MVWHMANITQVPRWNERNVIVGLPLRRSQEIFWDKLPSWLNKTASRLQSMGPQQTGMLSRVKTVIDDHRDYLSELHGQ